MVCITINKFSSRSIQLNQLFKSICLSNKTLMTLANVIRVNRTYRIILVKLKYYYLKNQIHNSSINILNHLSPIFPTNPSMEKIFLLSNIFLPLNIPRNLCKKMQINVFGTI